MKHTRGPWRLGAQHQSVDVQAMNGGAYVANANCSIAVDWNTKLANARLISAAPELLEALKEIVEYTGGASNALEDPYVMDRVNAAIAKAEGK